MGNKCRFYCCDYGLRVYDEFYHRYMDDNVLLKKIFSFISVIQILYPTLIDCFLQLYSHLIEYNPSLQLFKLFLYRKIEYL